MLSRSSIDSVDNLKAVVRVESDLGKAAMSTSFGMTVRSVERSQ